MNGSRNCPTFRSAGVICSRMVRPAAPDAGPAIAEADYHAAVSLTTFAFRQTLSRSPEDFWIQFEWFDVLGPRHTVLGAVEERGEEYEVIFTAQDPEWLHSTSFPAPPRATPSATSDHAAAPPTSEPARSQLTGRSNLTTSAWDRTLQFFREGMHHIFTGYDHLLFLLALIVVCRPWEIVKIVTSFTIAHSLTLALAALDVVTLPSRWVETGIAATIVYVALQNFSDRPKPHRWRLTFLFGLVHGFGFAGVLADLDLSAAGFVRALLAFNLGVEAGQLIVVGLMLVPILLLRRSRFEKVGRCAISAVVALCGAAWLVDRALALEWMPF